jgi:hypothetical protein
MLNRGDRLTADTLLEMSRGAASGLRARAGYGVVGGLNDRGFAIGVEPTAENLRDCIHAVHIMRAAAPMWGVVEVHSGIECGYGPDLAICRRPIVTCANRMGVLRVAGCVGDGREAPWVQIQGVTPVRVRADRALIEGERLTTFRDSYDAIPFCIGRLRVLADQGAFPGEPGVRLAIAQIVEEP